MPLSTFRPSYLAVLLVLAGCVGDQGSVSRDSNFAASRQSLIYTYPADAQTQVPMSAPVILRFSSAVVDSAPEQLVSLRDKEGSVVAFSSRLSDDGQSLILQPDSVLAPLTDYQLSVGAVALADGASAPGQFSFSTRARAQGPRQAVAEPGAFRVRHLIPDGEMLPILDFSSLRLQLSQPIDRATLRYGETIRLTGPEGLVPARLLVSDRYITIDPDGDLLANTSYQLELSSEVSSRFAESLDPFSVDITPQDSGNRAVLTQEVVDSNQGALRSPLTGEAINNVPLNAVLLGNNNSSQQTGLMQVELASLPLFPDTAPLRIAAGTRILGTSLPVNIGGTVGTGVESGEVVIEFISDAVGYMQANPLSPLKEAPRLIRLYMDVAISTADPRANGAVTQNLMHLELVGNAFVEQEKLVVNAVGMTEPLILGVEPARSLLSFNLVGVADQRQPPQPAVDVSAPQANGWATDLGSGLYRSGDVIVLNNSEALAEESLIVGDSVDLRDNQGNAVPFSMQQDGSALVLTPEQPLQSGSRYWVSLLANAMDQAGNAFIARSAPLDTASFDSISAPHAPVLLGVYPGFPCVTVDWSLADNDAGRCLGGGVNDDHLPVSLLPSDRPIRVGFSQPMDRQSINDQTLVVERINPDNTVIGAPVSGRLMVGERDLKFFPDQPWQPSALYRYRLLSTNTGIACGVNAICDQRGLPLQTRLLAQTVEAASGRTDGGPTLEVFFRGAEPTDNVLQLLHNLPATDSNANFRRDNGEADSLTDSRALLNSANLARNPQANPVADGTAALAVPADAQRTVVDVNIGCGFDGNQQPLNCPGNGLLFPSGDLFTDIVGPLTAAEVNQRYPNDEDIPAIVRQQGGVLAYVYPNQVYLSGTTVHTRQTNFITSIGISVPPTDTGVQLMRLRYRCDPRDDNCGAPDYGRIRGWIVEQNGAAQLLTTLQLYIDAPRLNPLVEQNGAPQPFITVSHDLRSKPLTLSLAGDITFLPDGRLKIEQISTSPLDIDVILDVSIVAENDQLFLHVPAGDTQLNYISEPIKP